MIEVKRFMICLVVTWFMALMTYAVVSDVEATKAHRQAVQKILENHNAN